MTKTVLKYSGILLVVFLLLWISFIISARIQTAIPENLTCDNIVILTGGKNRINFGIDLISKYQVKNLFISGVYKKTCIRDIIPEKYLGQVNIILGYEAKNTRENAKEIKELSQELNFHEIVLVTSDYHMARSIYEIRKQNPELTIYPIKVSSKFNSKFLFLSLREFYRIIYVYFVDILKGPIYD